MRWNERVLGIFRMQFDGGSLKDKVNHNFSRILRILNRSDSSKMPTHCRFDAMLPLLTLSPAFRFRLVRICSAPFGLVSFHFIVCCDACSRNSNEAWTPDCNRHPYSKIDEMHVSRRLHRGTHKCHQYRNTSIKSPNRLHMIWPQFVFCLNTFFLFRAFPSNLDSLIWIIEIYGMVSSWANICSLNCFVFYSELKQMD